MANRQRTAEFHTTDGKVRRLPLNGYNQLRLEPAPADSESLARRLDFLNDHYRGSFESVYLAGDGMYIEAKVFNELCKDNPVVIKPLGKK
ncbi:MAG: hypothetical protein QXU82_02450 [Candidatus Aenigmatarchaeota archaeon]